MTTTTRGRYAAPRSPLRYWVGSSIAAVVLLAVLVWMVT